MRSVNIWDMTDWHLDDGTLFYKDQAYVQLISATASSPFIMITPLPDILDNSKQKN
jgi:hypothetical protein